MNEAKDHNEVTIETGPLQDSAFVHEPHALVVLTRTGLLLCRVLSH